MKQIVMLVILAGTLVACSQPQAPDVHTQFIEDGDAHPLIILLGGSDGGNYFAAPEMHDVLTVYNDYGLSVASLGYFATASTPKRPTELSLNAINQRIVELASSPAIAENCIAVFGFSKGAELALLLGSHFDTVQQVVAAYPSHVSWNAVRSPFSRSGWSLDGVPLDYINAPLLSFPMLYGMLSGEYLAAFEKPLQTASAASLEKARIPVENIAGPVVLISGKQDEIWPSYAMATAIEQRLRQQGKHQIMHIALEGGHYSYDRHTMHEVLSFLQRTLVQQCQR